MYLGKITKINLNGTYEVEVPSLGLTETAYAVGPKTLVPDYGVGDLILVAETNREKRVILGYVYGQKK